MNKCFWYLYRIQLFKKYESGGKGMILEEMNVDIQNMDKIRKTTIGKASGLNVISLT